MPFNQNDDFRIEKINEQILFLGIYVKNITMESNINTTDISLRKDDYGIIISSDYFRIRATRFSHEASKGKFINDYDSYLRMVNKFNQIDGCFHIIGVNVDERLRGLGIGTELYRCVAIHCADLNCAMAPHSLLYGGSTSAHASYIWERLKREYESFGEFIIPSI